MTNSLETINFLNPKEINSKAIPTSTENQKFGTFLGVYVPCILMLFGVIIFLRLGWIVGLVGLSETLIIITLAASIALVTTLSMSSIATNTEIGKGGIYYMLSRSLGIEIGVGIGMPLFFRQSLSIAFCCIGFAESLHDLIPSWPITNIGIGALVVLSILAYSSVRGALKVQVGIFIAIAASLVSLFTGTDLTPIAPETFTPPALTNLGFWVVFAIFFPAMTGMESSVSLSGDLKKPARSLPIGTIGAILSAYLIYVAISIFLAYKVPGERLQNDPLIMQDLARIPSLIIVGIWGATLSSALGGLLAAPRTLQAIAEDGMAPKIFAKTFGAMSEPRIATLATCSIALAGTYFGSVNILAPLLTMISLISYCVLNLSAGMETLMANPSWRPRFRIHWAISLTGALACLITMLMIDVGTALVSIFLIAALYFFVKAKKFESNWSDIRDGLLLFFSRFAIYKLATDNSPSKSWRPHFLVFTGATDDHSGLLVKFAQGISQSKGFLTTASFITPGSNLLREDLVSSLSNMFKEEKIHSLVQVKEADTVTLGMQSMIDNYGIGPLNPNTIVFGGIKKENESIDFIKMLRLAYAQHKNIVILNKTEKDFLRKNIHIWWDDSSQCNSELMLVLGYMLQMDKSRKNTRLRIKATVSNEMDRKRKLEELEQISLEKRLPLDIDVYVSVNEAENRLSFVKEFSKEADIIFLGLKSPPSDLNKVEDYMLYLQDLTMSGEGLPLAFVLSSENTPLRSVLE
ncbi:MAG: amino acid permease [Parachlamydiaceae bacterium]|nr:amino acid permease [Parachlamydiaceae bacterium]